MQTVDTAVIGGGVIGLSCAFALAEQGQSVAVFDDARPGRATRAAAGMLAPLAEADSDGFFVRRGLESVGLYPDFLSRIHEASGHKVEVYGPGLLRIARTEEAEVILCRRLSWQMDLPIPQVRLSRRELLALEPNLPDDVRCGALSFQERHIKSRRLHAALELACRNRGVTMLAAQGSLTFDGDRVAWVKSNSGSVAAGNYVVSGGVWSAAFLAQLGLKDGVIYPVKGQACRVGYGGEPPVRHTVFTHEVYVVPRPNGEIVVGATQEPEAGYDTHVDVSTIDRLRAASNDFIQGMSSLPLLESWSGLRPFSADGFALIGKTPAHANVFACTGHGRNGVLFAPLTAQILCSAIVDQSAPPEELDPCRFSRSV